MLVKANELKEVNLFLFTLYIIFIIIKIKNLFFFLFVINERELDHLSEIEELLKVSLYI